MKEEDLKMKKKKIKKSTFFWKAEHFVFLLEREPEFIAMSIIKKILKVFFGSEVIGNSLEVILAKTPLLFAVSTHFWPKNFSHNHWSKEDFWKFFW